MKRNFAVPFLVILLVGVFAFSLSVFTVRASGTVYIRADGSVDPSTAPMATVNNVTYVFTGGISDHVVIERDDIVVDGAGNTLQGLGSDNGMLLVGRNNVTIKHVTIRAFDIGILLMSSSNIGVIDNEITDNNHGIKVVNSSDSNIFRNEVYANNGNGIDLSQSPNSSIHQNNVTTNAWVGIKLEGSSSSNTQIVDNSVTANGQSGIWLTDLSANNSVLGNDVTANSAVGIWVYNSSSNVLTNNDVANNADGIYLMSSSNNTLSGNEMERNRYNFGIYGTDLSTFMHSVDASNVVEGKPVCYFTNQSNIMISPEGYPEVGYLGFANCANITALGLDLTDNVQGVLLAFTNDSRIAGNRLAHNGAGVYLWSSANNTLTGNNLANNDYGVVLVYSSDNKILGNSLMDNPTQALNEDCHNIWNDGYPSGGNHWSDYNGTDSDHDGVGDSPYTIDGNNSDEHPLMGTFNSFNASPEYDIQTVCNSTISTFSFNLNDTTISFNVSGQTGTAGFCRICVPTALMNDTYRVFVNGTEVTYTTLPFSNSTHTYLYFTYTHSTEKVTIVPELPSALILPLLMMATLLALIAYRRKRSRPLTTRLTIHS
jgi:parallel beta-helix repeat protein